MVDFTFLTEEQIFGDDKLEILEKYGTKAIITEFASLLGGSTTVESQFIEGDSINAKTGCWWTKSHYTKFEMVTIGCSGYFLPTYVEERRHGARPVVTYSSISNLVSNIKRGKNGILEVEYGEYPQNIVGEDFSEVLERMYLNKTLKETGKKYTTDSIPHYAYNTPFKERNHIEYEYRKRKYIRIIGDYNCDGHVLFDGRVVEPNKPYWVSVKPIKWLVDEKTGIALSKKILFAGVQFENEDKYTINFNNVNIKKFMDNYFAKDIIYNEIEQIKQNVNDKKQNPYGFNFGQVSEEDIIRGCIESDIPVFLHGPSSEGKSARVKQIDPDCTIIYLRNASPESLNGKSVYDSSTGEMIDIKPTWLKKLEAKCEKEPNKNHILFFDEITNALPSIQGIAFNIVLDKEVNGIWKLPSNVRIVAAGNEMQDSLAANQLAEPLFNRFAHVYIKTTLESWLEWARENNIHPAIYSFVAYKNGEVLRSKYNGEKPNADPRKWEMVSKMLYATNKPEMIRSLVGEDITREFCHFCNQRVITLEDVLNDNYTDADLNINTAEKYATVMNLSQVDEENYYKVKEFVEKLGNEFVSLFDTLWIGNNDERLELVAESKIKNKTLIKQK